MRQAAPVDAGSQHWADLCEALQKMFAEMGGYGRVLVEIVGSAGVPVEIRIRERVPILRLGRTQPPLTGAAPVATLPSTE
jgi:hypothetical protein